MTDREWLECADPERMLEFLRGEVSARKLRLFAVACCRRIWAQLPQDRDRSAVETAERHADGLATVDDVRDCRISFSSISSWTAFQNAGQAAEDASRGAIRTVRMAAWSPVLDEEPQDFEKAAKLAFAAEKLERAAQATFLRDIFGNLFYPIAFDQAWLTSTVVALAQSIYDEKAFDHLPILADALEDAGCISVDILNHCRQPGEHVRGCWAVDLF